MKEETTDFIGIFLLELMLILTCILIRPEGLATNDGLSYYGVYRQTVTPYSLGLIVYAYFTWRLSHRFRGESLRDNICERLLQAIAVSLVGLVITPYNLIYGLHTIFGVGVFFSQLMFSLMIQEKHRLDRKNIILTIMEFLIGFTALYFLLNDKGYLMQAQIAFQTVFSILFLRILNKRHYGF